MLKIDQLNNLNRADVGDFEKTMAVTTVMTQSVISWLMTTSPSVGQQFFLGGIYEVIKFSAPAFIFGILFSTVRTHPDTRLRDYPTYFKNRWHILFIPSILWTTIYLVFLPQLQQHGHYHNWQSFCWQFINGNAASHLWYNTMMLQFIIIMPIFWWLARFAKQHPRWGIAIFVFFLLFEVSWHLLYEFQVFHGPEAKHWYFLDRVFPSFLIFGVSGTLFWVWYRKITPWLIQHWLAQLLVWLALLYIVTINFFNYGYPVHLTNAPYYLPSMVFYDLTTISPVATLLLHLQVARNQWLPAIHWIALYAHRSFLGHVFWLYWYSKGLQIIAPHLPLVVKFPLLVLLTIVTSFAFSYVAHIIWSGVKRHFNIKRLTNG